MTCSANIPKLAVAVAMGLIPAVGHAQLDDRAIVNMLRECREMGDASDRAACYDYIPLEERAQGEPAPPPTSARTEQRASVGFGSNQLPRAPAMVSPEPDRISARVTRVDERQPGVYLLSLEDGTQWQFVDSAPAAYDPPRPGAAIEISRASMGSYLLRYAGQRSVRTRRVR